MEYTYPNYYNKFNCISDKCEDTCCAGWQIMIDDKTMGKYVKYPGAFGNRLKNSIDFEEGAFMQNHRRCAFLNEDNFCDIYSEAGKDMLCRTCRNYPRHMEEFEGIREVSLSLSCPEVARIILGNKDKVKYITKDKDSYEEEYDDFNYILFSQLLDSRDAMINIMQNRDINIDTRMAMVLAFSHDIQRRIELGKTYEMYDVIDKYKAEDAYIRFEDIVNRKIDKTVSNRFNTLRYGYEFMYRLEVLKPEWTEFLDSARAELYGKGISNHNMLGKYKMDDIYIEQLMVYFIFTYYAGSIYDETPYHKIRLAVYSVIIINQLIEAAGSVIGFVDESLVVDISHKYAKEVEHSDKNLSILEDLFRSEDIFKINEMMKMIWS